MSWYLEAAKVYDREPCARTFEHDIYLHLTCGGIMLSTPACFAMVRSVCHDWPESRMLNPALTDASGDCWMVWLLAGDPRELWQLGPPKEWLAWQRNNVLKVRRYDTVHRLFRTSPRPAA